MNISLVSYDSLVFEDPDSTVDSKHVLGLLVQISQQLFPGIDSHCKRIHSSLTANRGDDGYLEKQSVTREDILQVTIKRNFRKSWMGELALVI